MCSISCTQAYFLYVLTQNIQLTTFGALAAFGLLRASTFFWGTSAVTIVASFAYAGAATVAPAVSATIAVGSALTASLTKRKTYTRL